jgi:hypothetical protein
MPSDCQLVKTGLPKLSCSVRVAAISILLFSILFGAKADQLGIHTTLNPGKILHIAVTNAVPGERYEVRSKSALSSVTSPWMLRMVGRLGQSNFFVPNIESNAEFFQAAKTAHASGGDDLLTADATDPSDLTTSTFGPQDIIFDTDPGLDADDISDLAIAHNLQKQGEIRILAMMGAVRSEFVAPCIEVVNRYYDASSIPIGTLKDGPAYFEAYYAPGLCRFYYNSLKSSDNAPDATLLYRQILSQRPDKSVTIVFVGPVRNLYNLWHSQPDSFSPLSGAELLVQKAKRLVVVACYLPDSFGGRGYNMSADPEAAQILNLVTNLPVSHIGIEQGLTVKIPSGIGTLKMRDFNPVRLAHYFNSVTNRPSPGGLGLLFAARGYNWRGMRLFTPIKGTVTITPDGANTFATNSAALTEYLIKPQNASYYVDTLDELVCLDSHKLDSSGDTIALTTNPTVSALSWGDLGTGFRHGASSNQVDFTVANGPDFRLSDWGITFDETQGRAPAARGISWTGNSGYGSGVVAAVIKDAVDGVRVASDLFGTPGRLTAREVFLGPGSPNRSAIVLGGDSNTGFLHAASGAWDFSADGKVSLRLGAPGQTFGATNGVFWASPAFGETPDTGLLRAAAGRVKAVAADGSLGNFEAAKFQTGQGWSYAGEKTVVKSADQSVTASVDLAPVDDLGIAIEADKTYTVRAVLLVHEGGDAAGLKMSVSGSVDAKTVWFTSVMKNGATSAAFAEALDFDQEMTYEITSSGHKYYTLEGTIVNGPNPGVVQLRFAQRAAANDPVTIKAGSSFTLKQVN